MPAALLKWKVVPPNGTGLSSVAVTVTVEPSAGRRLSAVSVAVVGRGATTRLSSTCWFAVHCGRLLEKILNVPRL